MKILKSPNFWVAFASVAGTAGIVCVVTGLLTSDRLLSLIGLWLLSPLMLGGVLLLLFVIPQLILANRRAEKRDVLTIKGDSENEK